LDAPRISNRVEAHTTEDIEEISDGVCNEEPVRNTQAGDDLFFSGCLSCRSVIFGHRFDAAVATGCCYLDLHPNKTTVGTANDFKAEKV